MMPEAMKSSEQTLLACWYLMQEYAACVLVGDTEATRAACSPVVLLAHFFTPPSVAE
jgi:hypothetical protein